MNESSLAEIGKIYQDVLLSTFTNFPSGSCYLSGNILKNVFTKLDLEARKVDGSLALRTKHGKLAVYGGLKLPSSNVIGLYHTWCEVDLNNNTYIVDPSLRFNKITLKKDFATKISDKVPDVLVTDQKDTYNWKYEENVQFEKFSDMFYNQIPDEVKNTITNKIIEIYK